MMERAEMTQALSLEQGSSMADIVDPVSGGAFWSVVVFDIELGKEDSFIVQTPSYYDDLMLIASLSAVHPEYDEIRIVNIPRPYYVENAYGDPGPDVEFCSELPGNMKS